MTQPLETRIPEEPAPTGALALAVFEASIAALVLSMYAAWLAVAAAAVLAAFTRFGAPPDPTAIWSTVPIWERQVDRLISGLEQIARAGWIEAGRQLGVELPFDPTDSLVQDQLARTRNLMVRTPDEVYRRIVDELGAAVANDESVDQQAARVSHLLDVTDTANWPARARTVSVTEVHRAYNMGGLAAALRIQQRESGPRMLKRWDAKDDSAVRPAHRLADGQVQFASQPFMVGGEPLMSPGDPSGSPWNVINCVTGDALIAASRVKKGFRYTYTGSMLAITREHGGLLTVSPNHPVLTERGWVLARQLNKGDYLVGAVNCLAPLVVDPDVKCAPAKAEEVFGSLMQSGVCERVEGLPVDFHGDGGNGDIDVVLVDGELSFGLHPQQREVLDDLNLIFADAPDASDGALDQLMMGSRNASHGIVGFSDLAESLSLLHATPLKPLSFGASPDGDPIVNEALSQCLARDASFTRERFQTLPVDVSLDQVVEIMEFDFHGPLYTFETASGVYIADQIVSHNCRCKQRFSRGTR